MFLMLSNYIYARFVCTHVHACTLSNTCTGTCACSAGSHIVRPMAIVDVDLSLAVPEEDGLAVG